MFRFLLLYVGYGGGPHCYAEGTVCFDQSVWVRGFWKEEEGKLFGSMRDLQCYLRDKDDLLHWRIQMIDEMPPEQFG